MRASLYNIAMWLFQQAVKAGGSRVLRWTTKDGSKKRRFVMGQRGLLAHIREEMEGKEEHPLCWVHCASLGEYGVARPLIRGLREKGWHVVLTFFSPSGYETLRRRKDVTDHLFYLPIDSCGNVRQFLDAVKPQKAVFIISEYWMNYLRELGSRGIPTYYVSMLVPNTSYLKKWYARPLRRALKGVTTFMVLDENSKRNMEGMGFGNCRVTGDPLFDNALQVAGEDWTNTVVEGFCQGTDEVFVAGSISDSYDLQMVCTLANRHPQMKFIMVPHELDEATISDMEARLDRPSLRYSACKPESDMSGVQTLIIDYIGDLARIYRYGRYAYVGGGFTPLLHSVIEPVVYGLPTAFGPNIHRKATPRKMMERGFAAIVRNGEELDGWYQSVRGEGYDKAHDAALTFARENGGATREIVNTITE